MFKTQSLSKTAILAIIWLATITLFCQTANQSTPADDFPYRHTLEYKDFTKLSISAKADVFLSQSDTISVEIWSKEADRLDYTTVELKDGKLTIKSQPYSFTGLSFFPFKWMKSEGKSFDTNMQIFIKMPTIDQITFGGRGSMTCVTDLELKSLEIKLAYHGQGIFRDINSQEVKIRTDSSADLQITNVVSENVDINIGYNAKAVFGDIHSNDVKIRTESSAVLSFSNVTATNRLGVNLGYNAKATFGDINTEDLTLKTDSSSEISFSNVAVVNSLGVNLGYNGKAILGDINSKDVTIKMDSSAEIRTANVVAEGSIEVNLGYNGKAIFGDITSPELKIQRGNSAEIKFGKLTVDNFEMGK